MKEKKSLFKILIYIFFSFVFICSFSIFNTVIYANENLETNNTSLNLFCNSGIAMDAETGNILYNNNCTKKIFPASTTKILTCIIAIENLNLDDTTIISKNVIQNTPYDSSVMGIKAGELYTIEELLYGLMLPSGNDAALALSEAVSGSTSDFIELMNKKAKELGCNETNFTNPHGYHDDNHYSTAYDMAIIFKYCIQNETFKNIICTNSITVKAANSDREVTLKNSNRMQNPNYTNYYYEYMKGGKTGYTIEARGTFIGYAQKDDKTVIAAAFDGAQNINGKQGRFLDTYTLLDYCFSKYSRKIIFNANDYIFKVYDEKNKKCYTIKTENDVYGLYEKNSNIEYTINIDYNMIDKILIENKNNYHNKIIGNLNLKFNFKDNDIVTTSNLKNNQNLILIDISNYIIKDDIYGIIFEIIKVLIIILIILYFLNKIINRKNKKNLNKKLYKNYDIFK